MFTRKVSYVAQITVDFEISQYLLDEIKAMYRIHDGQSNKIKCIKFLRDETAIVLMDGSVCKIGLRDAKNIVEDLLQIK